MASCERQPAWASFFEIAIGVLAAQQVQARDHVAHHADGFVVGLLVASRGRRFLQGQAAFRQLARLRRHRVAMHERVPDGQHGQHRGHERADEDQRFRGQAEGKIVHAGQISKRIIFAMVAKPTAIQVPPTDEHDHAARVGPQGGDIAGVHQIEDAQHDERQRADQQGAEPCLGRQGLHLKLRGPALSQDIGQVLKGLAEITAGLALDRDADDEEPELRHADDDRRSATAPPPSGVRAKGRTRPAGIPRPIGSSISEPTVLMVSDTGRPDFSPRTIRSIDSGNLARNFRATAGDQPAQHDMRNAETAGEAEHDAGQQPQADQLGDEERDRQPHRQAEQEVLVERDLQPGLVDPPAQQVGIRQRLADELVEALGVASVIDNRDAALGLSSFRPTLARLATLNPCACSWQADRRRSPS